MPPQCSEQVTTTNHDNHDGATESQSHHRASPQVHSQTRGDMPLSSSSSWSHINKEDDAHMDLFARPGSNIDGTSRTLMLHRSRRQNTTGETVCSAQSWPPLASRPVVQAVPIYSTLSANFSPTASTSTSPSQPTTYPDTSTQYSASARRRELHKKPRSYDLRDNFTQDAPAAHAALEILHARHTSAELHGSGCDSSNVKQYMTHRSTPSEPRKEDSYFINCGLGAYHNYDVMTW